MSERVQSSAERTSNDSVGAPDSSDVDNSNFPDVLAKVLQGPGIKMGGGGKKNDNGDKDNKDKGKKDFSDVESAGDIPSDLSNIKFLSKDDLKKDEYKQFKQSGSDVAFAIDVKDNVAYFETVNGERFKVKKDDNLDYFKAVEKINDSWGEVQDAIKEKDRKLLGKNDDVPVLTDDAKVKDLAPGVKAIDIEGRGKYLVMEDHTPEHYSIVVGDQISLQADKVDDAFSKSGLPKGDETDIMMAETTEDGKTVAELYHEYMVEAYKDLPDDSKQAKYLRLMDARDMLSGGFNFLPYNTGNGRYGGADTEYASEMAELNPADARGMIHEGKLGEELLELLTDEDIIADSEKFLEKAIDKLKDKKELEDKIADTMLEDEYLEVLQELQDGGNSEAAAARYASDLQSLKHLNPDRAADVENHIKFSIPLKELNDIFEEGSGAISEEDLLQASGDIVTSVLTAISTTMFGTKRGVDIFNKIMNGDKVDISPEDREKLLALKNSKEVLTNLVGDQAARNLDDPSRSHSITTKDIDDALDKSKVPLDQRKGVTGVIGKLVKTGTLSSMAGLASMVAGIYKMSDGGLGLGETAEERMEVARNFMTLVGVTPSLVNMTNESYKLLAGKEGVADAIGLDKSLKESVWDKHFKPQPAAISVPESFQLQELDFGKTFTSGDIFNEVNTNLGEQVVPLDDRLSELPEEQRNNVTNNIDRIAKDIRGPNMPEIDSNKKFQWVGGALNVLGGMADAGGGLLDVVLGAKGLDKLASEGGEPIEFVQKGLQLGSGTFATVAGLASISSGLGIGTQIAGRVAAGFGIGGPILGFAGGIVSMVMSILADKKNAGVAEDIRDVFRQLDKDGVTEKDWGDKFNYVIHMEYEKSTNQDGRRDPLFYSWFPDDIPMWEAQPEHFKEFTEHVADKGLLDNGWFRQNEDKLVMNEYGREFFEENRDKIELISRKWTDWDGSDDIVSRKDFEKILDDPDTSKKEKEAVEWLMGDETFFELLDTFNDGWSGGKPRKADGKISSKDLNKWRELWLGEEREERIENDYGREFYEKNRDKIELISKKWTDWDGSDDIVSRKDFEKILDDPDTSKKEKEAVEWLLNDDFFFEILDTFAKGGKPDDKISSKDLNQWREQWIELEREEYLDDNYGQKFYDKNRDYIEHLSKKWTDWDGSDDIVSRKDFEKILADSKTPEKDKKVVEWLLNDKEFFEILDTFAKGDKPDGKISSKDLNKWREQWM